LLAQLRLGTNSAITIWPTAALTAGTVMAVDPAAIAFAAGVTPRIEASIETNDSLRECHAGSNRRGRGSQCRRGPVRSAFQQDLVVLRCILDATWVMRQSGMVAVVTGATWG
jgi:hypothetical protein